VFYSFIEVFESKGKTVKLINSLASAEIDTTMDPGVLFRGNSIVSIFLEAYFRLVANYLLNKTLKNCIRDLYKSTDSFEIDPLKIDSESDKELKVQKNFQKLIKKTAQIWQSIRDTVGEFPRPLRRTLRHLSQAAKAKWPEDTATQYTARTGFLFLRFFCPALLNPHLFDLADDAPPPIAARNFTLISKLLMTLANLTSVGKKEPYLAIANSWLEENKQMMMEFIDAISIVPKRNGEEKYNKFIDDMSYKEDIIYSDSMAHIQSVLKANLEGIKELPTNPILSRLLQILKDFDLIMAKQS